MKIKRDTYYDAALVTEHAGIAVVLFVAVIGAGWAVWEFHSAFMLTAFVLAACGAYVVGVVLLMSLFIRLAAVIRKRGLHYGR